MTEFQRIKKVKSKKKKNIIGQNFLPIKVTKYFACDEIFPRRSSPR